MARRSSTTARPVRDRRPSRSSGLGILPYAALIVAAGLVAHRSSFSGVFVLDDGPAIVHNTHLRQLWPLSQAMSAPPEVTVSGRPTTSLSLAVNYALASPDVRDALEAPGPDAPPGAEKQYLDNLWGYHALNLLIHLSAALLLFGVVRRTLAAIAMTSTEAPVWASQATFLSASVALLWCVHPLQTGAVTYIVQRAESLMGLCFLGTLYCAIRAHEPGRARVWSIASVAVCAIGMGAKEVMVVAPVMVVLWDWLMRRQMRARLYAALAGTWLILGWLIWTHPRTTSVGFGFSEWPWWRYLLTQAEVVVHYLRLSIVPTPLVLDYGWPPAPSLFAVAPEALLVIALLAATGWLLWRRHPAAFAGAWFFAILAPTSSVVPVATEVAAEHRMYLPLAAVVVLVVLGIFAIARRAGDRRTLRVMWPVVGGLVVGATLVTDARNRDYASDERIWQDTVEKRPSNPRARNNLAVDLLLRGANTMAETHLREAVALDPRFADAHANLGVALCRQDKCREGMTHLEQALALAPGAASVHRDLAEAYAAQGRMSDAVAHYLAALERWPDDVMLLNRAAWILATTSDEAVRSGSRAIGLAERAVRLTSRQDPISLDSLAASLAAVGRFDEALRTGAEALSAARSQGQTDLFSELESRLARYRAGQPLRER